MGTVIPISTSVMNIDHHIIEDDLDVFTRIYDDAINLVVYERQVSSEIVRYTDDLMKNSHSFSFTKILELEEVTKQLEKSLPEYDYKDSFISDIYNSCEIFTVLFDIEKIGLRLTVLEHAMCPRFHVDNIPCRLITTYGKTGTEWLSENNVNRKKLGRGNNGVPDETSGIYLDANQINKVNSYDIALLKGEVWPKNAGNGIVHRSPEVNNANPRLLLSLDFV